MDFPAHGHGGPTTPPSDKGALRRALRDRRRAFVARLDGPARDAVAAALAARVVPRLAGRRIVAGYVPLPAEVDPTPIMAALARAGAMLALPRVESRAEPMRFVRYAPGHALVEGPFGLRQPPPGTEAVAPDAILTPLVGFDRALNRLGQGAGHYDRAFAGLPDARRIGLAWACQEWEALPADPWDVPLHAIATEREWLER